ncbi:hypothetical protein [Thiohalomonas denitrificans]|uniref:hypothetical protein n=1 Tax=Thiohalomonas denitrificans TaxID=415747 RepID=UPI0026F1EC5E|nr:hypothetical protein [Thiohalomonas denitrificans]
MQYNNKSNTAGLILGLTFFIGGVQTVHAAGTESGITISNSATVDYQVGGVDQTQLTSNAAEFVVDNRVDLTVANPSGTSVVPNSTAQALTFTVTNTGNTEQGYSLSAANTGGDDFDMTNVAIYIEDGTTPGFQSAEDTQYSAGANASDLAADTSTTVYVVADTPATALDGEAADIVLTATTLDAGTSAITVETVGANNAGAVDVVFGDGAGAADAASDGIHSAIGTYTVTSAALTVSKSVAVTDDPFNGTTDPKAIPGATMRYTIDVQNGSTTTAADNVVLVDAPPANTSYEVGTITLNGAAKTDGAGDDEADFNGTNANAVTVTIPTVAAGGTATITFDVTID